MSLIIFNPSEKNLLYDVKINTYNKNAKKQNRELIYKIKVKKEKDTFSDSIVNFQRFDLVLDNTKVHCSIDEITILIGRLFEDVSLKISPYGEIKKVNNYNYLKEIWDTEIKYKISKTYKGLLVENMLANIDLKMNNESLFIESLSRDPFFYSYFFNIYGEYTNNIKHHRDIINSFGGIKNFEVNYKFEIDNLQKNTTLLKGTASLSDSEKDRLIMINKVSSIDYSFYSNYVFNELKQIDSLSLSQNILIEDDLSMKQEILTRLIV